MQKKDPWWVVALGLVGLGLILLSIIIVAFSDGALLRGIV
jgi:hypothetical protein